MLDPETILKCYVKDDLAIQKKQNKTNNKNKTKKKPMNINELVGENLVF